MKKISVFLCFAIIFASLFGSSVYAAELSDYPAMPPVSQGSSPYFIFESTSGDIYLFTFKDIFNVGIDLTFNYNDNDFVVTNNAKDSVQYFFFVLKDNAWSSVSSSTINKGSSTLLNSGVAQILYSDINVYDNDNNLVFPVVPMTPTLEQAIQESLEGLHLETTETMKIIALCGVGCLALLIGLYLLPKVLYRFL